jgi:ribulose-5-phosphate 4-epimerase/fuculose-1-phosphate aldolase
MPESVDEARRNLVLANRVLAREGILDAFGHVSVRHPADARRFLLAWARAPELIEDADVLEFGLDGELLQTTDKQPYLERYIHAAMYEQRHDVMAVCHNHTPSILPFCISRTARLRPVIHTAAMLGGDVPVWDIADEFGPTNLLVTNMAHARSLARVLGGRRMALMRGHGSVVVDQSVPALVLACINMDKNARVQLQAIQLGEYTPLSPGEIERPPPLGPRAWEAYVRRITGPA